MGPRLVILACVLAGLSAFVSDSAGQQIKLQQENQTQKSKLVKLAIIFRHGDRPPPATCPTDPYPYTDLNHWPDGAGQLTTNGKKRMLRLGQLIRERYNDFLGENPIESYVRSSGVDRCLASAELVMAGVYSPTAAQQLSPNLNWQPIPIHSRNEETDGMLSNLKFEDCPAGRRVGQLQSESEVVKGFMRRKIDVKKEVEKWTGMNNTTLTQMALLYGTLDYDRMAGKRMPDWVTDDLMARITEFQVFNFCVMESGRKLQPLHAGVLLHDLEKVLSSPNPLVIDDIPRKAFFYSTHGSRFTAVLNALNATGGLLANAGSSITFEMHEIAGPFVIRTSYMKDPMEEIEDFVPLKTRGCPKDGDCGVQQFFSGLREFITDEETHRKECSIIPVVAEEVDCVM